MEPWKALRPVLVDAHHFNDEHDRIRIQEKNLNPDPHKEMLIRNPGGAHKLG